MPIIVFQDQAKPIHNRADREANMPPLSKDGQRIAKPLDIYHQMVDH